MPHKKLFTALALLLTLFLPTQASAHFNDNDILKQYVEIDDGAFSYQQVSSTPQTGLTAYVYKMTSQKWRTAAEVDRPVWEHQLLIIVPDTITNDKALLFIYGGDNTPDYLTPDPARLDLLSDFALQSGSIIAQVSQVPNQPLVFFDEPQGSRVEDDLVAYSWDTAMGGNDFTWAAYLPMTKSVVKAMDAVQMVANDLELSVQPIQFVLTGISKRGAITWLTPAVDNRVIAISPNVFDTLNFAPSVENQRATYGEFAEPLKDYTQRNVLDRFRTVEGQQLIDVIDPYSYRDRISIPKYIINVSGDQFFPPDSSLYYIDDLTGESLLRYVPNTDHGGANGGFESSMRGLLAWYQRIAADIPRPRVDWRLDETHWLWVTVSDPAASAVLWSAHNTEARDFRLETFGPNWQATPIAIGPDGMLETMLDVPETGWSAYFVEITFPGTNGLPDQYTTPAFILPETRPFDLAQARLVPKSKSEWREILAAITSGEIVNSTLTDAFPIRSIGDESVATVGDAHSLLARTRAGGKTGAQQECLVVRLNIKDGQIDWYSHPAGDHSVYLWTLWNVADFFYRIKIFQLSEWTCKLLNRA